MWKCGSFLSWPTASAQMLIRRLIRMCVCVEILDHWSVDGSSCESMVVVVACLMKHATKTIRMITHLVYLHHMRRLWPTTTTATAKNCTNSQLQRINCLLSRILCLCNACSLDSKCAMSRFHICPLHSHSHASHETCKLISCVHFPQSTTMRN